MKKLAIIVILLLGGCSHNYTILHPITPDDIQIVKKGEQYTAPKDGLFLSDMYVKEVMQAKLDD